MRGLVVLLLICIPGFGAVAAWNVIQIDGRKHVPVSDVANFYRMVQTNSTPQSFRLVSSNRTIEGRAGTSFVLINGVKYVTCFPLRTHAGRVYLSAMDVTKIIEPIMRPGKIATAQPVRTVVLDAGHGGHDSGAVGPLGREKQYTLDVVLRARALLMRAGFNVKLTRATDVFIPLEDRAKFANKFPDAVFVSVHFNKSKSNQGTGVETYALAPRGVPSMDEENLRYSDFKLNPGNARDAENIALAAAVHSALVRNLRMPDRGIKRARFVVIKNIRIPGVLIEGGFVNNPSDSRLIARSDFRQRIAQSVADAVVAYTRTVTGAAPRPSAVVTVAPPTELEETAPSSPPEAASTPSASPAPSPSGTPAPTDDATPSPSPEPAPEATPEPSPSPAPTAAATATPAPTPTPVPTMRRARPAR